MSFHKNWLRVHTRFEVSFIKPNRPPVVEAYIGEYASGKSEIAINRALDLLGSGRQVTLVDLDLVEPFYTLRPLKKELEALGLEVLAWETNKTMGLGEAGYPLLPEIRWALARPHDIILDVGYGVEGAKVLNLLEGGGDNPHLRILAVINGSRPLTSSVELIVDYVKTLGKVHGLINNTHLGEETTPEIVQAGAKLVTAGARELGLPVVATGVWSQLVPAIGDRDLMGNPVWSVEPFMARAFW